MKFAIVGCGYVADFYAKTRNNYDCLEFVGAYDVNESNVERFLTTWPGRRYRTFSEMLEDDSVELVMNLTNPRSHYQVTMQCLKHGKHVYSEKPLAMHPDEALHLAEIARINGLYLASAPCSVLGEAAQTMWRALRENAIGRVRLVYANFEDGMIAPHMRPWLWANERNIPWPAKDEFEVGCTYEHAGYILTWLAAFFGPARRVTSFASVQIPDKGIQVENMAPDFNVACLEYDNGIVARFTCGLVAPKDRSITIIGDDGVLFVGNVRDDRAPVMFRPSSLKRWERRVARHTMPINRWFEGRIPWIGESLLFQRRYRSSKQMKGALVSRAKPVDFLRGPAELVNAIHAQRACRLSPELGCHLVELIDALQNPHRYGGCKTLSTTFPPPQPLS